MKRVVFTSEASAALCKALRIHTWIDTTSYTSLFGIQARLAPRQWAHVAANGAPLLFDTEAEARRKMGDLLERQP